MVYGAARWGGMLAAGLWLLPNAAGQQVSEPASMQNQAAVTQRAVALRAEFVDGAQHPYCAVLDAAAFAESAPGLRGLHLMQDGAEIPFLTTISEPASPQTDKARMMNLREQDGMLVFDLEMPQRAYSSLVFNLPMKDFAATVLVEAGESARTRQWRRVGEFVLFDLSRDKLARRTAVALPEMQDRYLHITLRVQATALRAEDLLGVDVPPSREAQTIYSTVATTDDFSNTVRETIAEFDVPAHVPVQRIHFDWNAKKTNFMSRVRVEAWAAADPNAVETISGAISSTHRVQSGLELEDSQHDVPMTLGANLQGPAHMRVIVERNGDAPLPLTGIALLMRQHKICFDAKSESQIVLRAGGDDSAAGSVVPALANEAWERANEAVIGDGAVVSEATAPRACCRRKNRWVPVYYGGAVVLLGGVILLGWRLRRSKG